MTMPTVVPMISYEDAVAALDWLASTFGFHEQTRMENDDGSIGHAEMTIGDGLIMLAEPTPDYESPRHHRDTCAQSAKWQSVPWVIDGFYVQVEDVDAHFDRAKAMGARILSEPEEAHGARSYRVEDLEGHRWMFATPTSEVDR
ncbi:MAG: VOC family protein [Actinobacteria bacterium]|nr:VOC family protein [Actinomycetota bacterium]